MDKETGAKSIGAMAQNALAMISSNGAVSTSKGRAVVRLNDDEIAKLRHAANIALRPLEPVPVDYFAKCLRVLLRLPRRIGDELGGNILVTTYHHKLGHFPREAIDFMCNRIMETCHWFPTVAECLAIMREWKRPDLLLQEDQRRMISQEMQNRMEETMAAMKARALTQAEIDALSDKWKRIAEERGYLRRSANGYEVRHEPEAINPPENEREETGAEQNG